ncbi:IS5 family transposase [Microbulbifer spongiae]|uniref:IS5 family transposase n=1 Tax=Microbulbifer spongiae TaxID=2944933 RepID=A0ABY9EBN8_9GAMM|nr:IS5 family transposase [Microbulbifer sp. MI-G]WKD48929.1 IS5 family transposase [Microbulbifer sp. MI-G]
MEISKSHFKIIEHLLPVQKGNVKIPDIQIINAILYVAEHGCKWRGLPERFGKWYSIYMRANRWAKKGVLDHVFVILQGADVVNIQVDTISLDSTAVKVHPDGAGAFKKNGPQSIGKSRAGWTTKIHMVAADDKTAVITFALSPGQSRDAPEGRSLLETLENCGWEGAKVLMDKAYEGDETRQLVLDLGMIPVFPPKVNRINPWKYDRKIYKKRNEVERLFRRLKGFRRIFSRFNKLDAVFRFFINFSLIADRMISVDRP